jgi:hypothetical protein
MCLTDSAFALPSRYKLPQLRICGWFFIQKREKNFTSDKFEELRNKVFRTPCPVLTDSVSGGLSSEPARYHSEAPSRPWETDMTDPLSPLVLVLVRDLLLGSRVTAAARSAGVESRIVREPASLGQASANRLVVDLNLPGALEAAIEWKNADSSGRRQVFGFVSHVDVEMIRAARAAGIDQVLPRSALADKLPALLREGS